MSTFNQKKVYHSYLKQASPLVVRFKSQPLESKFQEGQWVMYFDVRGDTTEGYYILLENDSIRATLQDAVGTGWTKLVAIGSGADASVTLSQPDGIESNAPDGASNDRTTEPLYDSIPEAYAACLTASETVISKWLDSTEVGKSSDDNRLQLTKDVATTFFINIVRNASVPSVLEAVQEDEPEESDESSDDIVTVEHIEILKGYYDQVDWDIDKTHDNRDAKDVQQSILGVVEKGVEAGCTVSIMRNMMGWMDKQLAFQSIHKTILPLESGVQEDDLPF